MLKRLKKHWGVNTRDLILILCTFAVSGSVTAWLSKKIAEWLLLDQYGLAWWSSKILVFIFGYQALILIFGFCFGMFPFFWKYEKKILKRLGMKRKITGKQQPTNNNRQTMTGVRQQTAGDPGTHASQITPFPSLINIAIFASGAGSNARQIIHHFKESTKIKVALIVCNNPKAGVLDIAAKENIPVLLIEKNKFLQTGYIDELKNYNTGFIVLAGFLWQIPPVLINAYQNKIINIHPALLPAYGGKGMYGKAVHSSVIEAGEKESGITIHYVDERYDHGKIIFQTKCSLDEKETAESLALKVHQLEHDFYPKIIASVLNNINS